RTVKLKTWTTFTKDIYGWSAGDLLQLYIVRGGDGDAQAKNLRLYADQGPLPINIMGDTCSPLTFLAGQTYKAGDIVIGSADTERNVAYYTWTKVKEIKIGGRGVLRTHFQIRGHYPETICHGRIYRNGVAVGTIQTKAGTGWGGWAEDIDGWSAGDLAQLYVYMTAGPSMYHRFFRISCDNPLTPKVILD
ncbi:unnamed protein product, partial [marine sediment metagenome]